MHRVWVRVGYPRKLKNSGVQPTTELSYSLKIKLNTCKNNSFQYILKQSVNQNVRYADFKLFVNIFDFDLIMKTTLL
jgi:hypothetical protein